MKNSLIDKVIIITGASSGIGEKMAEILAGEGAKVVLAARREEKLREIVDSIGCCARYKVVDVLINNAGIMLLSPIGQLKVDESERMADVNLKGSLYAIVAAHPYLKRSAQDTFGDITIYDYTGRSITKHRIKCWHSKL